MNGKIWNGQLAPCLGGLAHGVPVGWPPTTGPLLNEFAWLPPSVNEMMQPVCGNSAAVIPVGTTVGRALHHSYQPALGTRPKVSLKLCTASASCLRLFKHLVRREASRAD